MERTLVIVKPDAVARGLVGHVLSRFEAAGFEIVRIRFELLPKDRLQRFYAEHRDKWYYARLIEFMLSGPSLFVEMRHEQAIHRARNLVGATDPCEAAPGTIRGDLGDNLPRNCVHASDSPESADREIRTIFGED